MPRFAKLLEKGLTGRGHNVKSLSPQSFFYKLPSPATIKKWLGYADQFIVFPREVKKYISQFSSDTIFVFTDHALGPWVPLVAHRPHIIFCHDFLAQRSALREIPENPTSRSGRKYQSMIRKGYSQGKYFITVSQKTKEDLKRLSLSKPQFVEVIHNGLNKKFFPENIIMSRDTVEFETKTYCADGYILHVGGNQWYKNRRGVIDIYNCWRLMYNIKLPLLMIGAKPNRELLHSYEVSPFRSDIHFLTNVEDDFLCAAYSGARVLLFPSLAEGFGWPVAEAMACGCPVITTDEAPMTEVAEDAAFYIPRRPLAEDPSVDWAVDAAKILQRVINLNESQRAKVIKAGLVNAKKFDADKMLDKFEKVCYKIFYSEVKLKTEPVL